MPYPAPLHRGARASGFAALLTLSLALVMGCSPTQKSSSTDKYHDNTNLDHSGKDWPGYGRTYGEQHYSPLSSISAETSNQLGLAWSYDLPNNLNPVTQPIAVDGVLYFAVGYSVIHAIDAASGALLWTFDPKVPEAAGPNLRVVWGSRGIAWWDNKIYTGTADGRLIAVDAKTGKKVWSRRVFPQDSYRFISGAPRVFDGKVVTGFSGTIGPGRSHIDTFEANTGKHLWRFYTTPGNPKDGFESEAMRMAAQTWAGDKWWQFGGGGSVWNAMAYDPDTDSLFIGTGSGHPWNRRVRSKDQGDNLFISSIVSINASTGSYQWHYQTTPGDTWDYDATMDIQLADINIDGKARKVLIQAPKNGFFYVIDRISGELLSAEKYTRVSWAERIDLETGRPVETTGARYPNGSAFATYPSPAGGHNWTAMAYSPKTQFAYIPVLNRGVKISDAGIDTENWQLPTNRTQPGGWAGISILELDEGEHPAALLAWDISAKKPAWSVPYPTDANGGVLATGGNLVFQGTIDGHLNAYAATNGKKIWNYDTGAPIMAAPISYEVNGEQYITVLTGLGTGHTQMLGIMGVADDYKIDSRTMPRRALSFKLGGEAKLLGSTQEPFPIMASGYEFDKPDAQQLIKGFKTYFSHCHACHGLGPSTTHAPDLRRSAVPVSPAAFASVVRDGALISRGMPAFEELSDDQLLQLRHLIFATSIAGAKGEPPLSALPEALQGMVSHQ